MIKKILTSLLALALLTGSSLIIFAEEQDSEVKVEDSNDLVTKLEK